ncbi:hypothetical protein OSTOST_14134 [Ostertagia ostertagi]
MVPMVNPPLPEQLRTDTLMGFLEARSSSNCVATSSRLTAVSLARQQLSDCKQGRREFADRLEQIVKKVTRGQPKATQNERLLDEYLDRLKPDVWSSRLASDSKEFALSFSLSSSSILDRGYSLIFTDQSYAIGTFFSHRSKRATSSFIHQQVGLASTNQLAARRLAVEDSMQESMSSAFHHAIRHQPCGGYTQCFATQRYRVYLLWQQYRSILGPVLLSHRLFTVAIQ